MERKGWLWKKRITDKLASAALEFKQNSERLDSQLDLKEATTPLQQAEARLKILTEQLCAKDDVVQQHAKVAEEAVSGWEKAECEAANMKQQLDEETCRRIAAEDQIFHLDGALKECTRQLRLAKEQQNQRIYEALTKKTQEWEEVRGKMEANMAKMANEFLDSEAEKAAMLKSLQERAILIKEAKDGRSQAEEEVKLLQVRLELLEKEQVKWKYEVHVLKKELEIRNEELEYNKKASELANKQHLENVKKVVKLESECQRLRLLVRKKLPGPAAVAQMRMEVEALGMLPSSTDRSKRMSPRWNQNRQQRGFMESTGGDTDRLLIIEEENRALKEALGKSNEELHAVQLLVAQTAGKLYLNEEHLEISSQSCPKTPRSICDAESRRDSSTAEKGEEMNCAESWASSLMSELAHFGKKDKVSSASEIMMDAASCDFMDDFAEMEKLASMPPDRPITLVEQQLHLVDVSACSAVKDPTVPTLEESMNLSTRLTRTEQELNALKLQRLTAKTALLSAESHLSSLMGNGNAVNVSDIFSEVHLALTDVIEPITKDVEFSLGKPFAEVGTAELRDTRAWSPGGLSSCHSEENLAKQENSSSKKFLKDPASELAHIMHKVVSLVEVLAQVDYDGNDPVDSFKHSDDLKQWRSYEFDSCVQSLLALCHGVLQSKVEIFDFVVEITSALEWLMNHIFPPPSNSLKANSTQRCLDWDKGSINTNQSPLISKESSCHPPRMDSPILLNNQGVSSSVENPEITSKFEEEVAELKLGKESAQEQIKLLSNELELFKSQLQESTSKAGLLQSDLSSALESKKSLMDQVSDLSSDKSSLESQLCSANKEIRNLEKRIHILEKKLQHETKCCKDTEDMFHELQQNHFQPKGERGQAILEVGGDNSSENALKKDKDIAAAAEKLAECQQTILALGKQLKDLGVGLENGGALGTDETAAMHQRIRSLSDQLPTVSTSNSGSFCGGVTESPSMELGQHKGVRAGVPDMETGHYGPQHGREAVSYGQLSPLGDTYRAATVPLSPERQNSDRPTVKAASKNLALTSPGRSPARFLGFKGRHTEPRTEFSSLNQLATVERNSTGSFSRFFSRTKMQRQVL